MSVIELIKVAIGMGIGAFTFWVFSCAVIFWLMRKAVLAVPFEYFPYRGELPKRWLIAEYFLNIHFSGTDPLGHYFRYSDGVTEFVGWYRVTELPPGCLPLRDSTGRLCGWVKS